MQHNSSWGSVPELNRFRKSRSLFVSPYTKCKPKNKVLNFIGNFEELERLLSYQSLYSPSENINIYQVVICRVWHHLDLSYYFILR